MKGACFQPNPWALSTWGAEWAQGRDAVGRPRPSERDPLFIWSLKHLGLSRISQAGRPQVSWAPDWPCPSYSGFQNWP